MNHWRVYYDDGTVYTSDDGPTADAPKTGVICITEPDRDHGRRIVSSADYYWQIADGSWYGGDLFGLWDYLSSAGSKIILFGRMVPTDQFDAITQHALTDECELPQKTAWNAGERRRVK